MLRADSASDSSLAISFRILQPASAAATASGPWRMQRERKKKKKTVSKKYLKGTDLYFRASDSHFNLFCLILIADFFSFLSKFSFAGKYTQTHEGKAISSFLFDSLSSVFYHLFLELNDRQLSPLIYLNKIMTEIETRSVWVSVSGSFFK